MNKTHWAEIECYGETFKYIKNVGSLHCSVAGTQENSVCVKFFLKKKKI